MTTGKGRPAAKISYEKPTAVDLGPAARVVGASCVPGEAITAGNCHDVGNGAMYACANTGNGDATVCSTTGNSATGAGGCTDGDSASGTTCTTGAGFS